MKDRLAAEWTVLVLFKFSCDILAVLVCCVVLALAFCALQSDDFNSSLFLASHFINSSKFFIS